MPRVLSEEQTAEAKKIWTRITRETKHHPATTSWLDQKPKFLPASQVWRYKGYMTQRQLLVFLKTEEGSKFCGVDLSLIHI